MPQNAPTNPVTRVIGGVQDADIEGSTGQRCSRGERSGEARVEFGIVRSMGIKVLEVPGLNARVCFVEGEDVALVRSGMSHQDRCECADWVMLEATEAATAETSVER
jgi:hypothetical protein